MSRKIIAIDMDETIAVLMKKLMTDHNEKHPEHSLTYDQVVAFDHSLFHPDYDVVSYMREPGVFLDLELIDEYVVDEVRKLHEAYDVIIVTSAFPEAVLDKWRWLQKHFPFIPEKNFCTFSRKDLIHADLLIDDAIHNVKPWVEKGKQVFVPRHHWNHSLECLNGVTMFSTWKGLKEQIDTHFNAAALISWLEHRLEHADRHVAIRYIKIFQDMWKRDVGPLHLAPVSYRNELNTRYAH